jgi:hypothetical protein
MRRQATRPSTTPRLLVGGLVAAAALAFGTSPAMADPGNGQSAEHAQAAPAPSDPQADHAANDHAAEDHGSSGHDAASSSTVTEDTDTNDGGTPNNVADDGDNRHPSGRDRSVESGGSGNQGNAMHDPDDDGHGPDRSNGGIDQPDGSGGIDRADQDGNNGCGNDDDFEDDNEGWCGHHPHADHRQHEAAAAAEEGSSTDTEVAPAEATESSAAPAGDLRVDVVADRVELVPAVTATSASPAVADVVEASVLGAEASRGDTAVRAAGIESPRMHAVSAGSAVLATLGGAVGAGVGALAFTGLNAMQLVALAVALLVVGFVLRAKARRA